MTKKGKKMKTIKITCKGYQETINYKKLINFQGNLKTRTKKDIENMAKSIIKFGFSFPFYVWKRKRKNYCIDGHGRIDALNLLEKDQYIIPELPIIYIQARTIQEAKRKLLRLNSQYGKITKEGLVEFVGDMDIMIDEVQLPAGEIKLSELFYTSEDIKYSKKILSPIYKPTKEKPEISQLYDMTKTKKLIKEIKKANIKEEEKKFLIEAAKRHTVFNYGNIAEYYAHSDKEMQELMEKSALVIIDYNKAIEQGYIEVVESLKRIYNE